MVVHQIYAEPHAKKQKGGTRTANKITKVCKKRRDPRNDGKTRKKNVDRGISEKTNGSGTQKRAQARHGHVIQVERRQP
mgnify:CR=1 FL=1